jgi:hypothetical protein
MHENTLFLSKKALAFAPLTVLLYLFIISLTQAFNLAKPDMFSSPNPYCVIRLNGHELGGTDPVASTTDPIFTDERIVFQVHTFSPCFLQVRSSQKGFSAGFCWCSHYQSYSGSIDTSSH